MHIHGEAMCTLWAWHAQSHSRLHEQTTSYITETTHDLPRTSAIPSHPSQPCQLTAYYVPASQPPPCTVYNANPSLLLYPPFLRPPMLHAGIAAYTLVITHHLHLSDYLERPSQPHSQAAVLATQMFGFEAMDASNPHALVERLVKTGAFQKWVACQRWQERKGRTGAGREWEGRVGRYARCKTTSAWVGSEWDCRAGEDLGCYHRACGETNKQQLYPIG